jgi:hypothetical protein
MKKCVRNKWISLIKRVTARAEPITEETDSVPVLAAVVPFGRPNAHNYKRGAVAVVIGNDGDGDRAIRAKGDVGNYLPIGDGAYKDGCICLATSEEIDTVNDAQIEALREYFPFVKEMRVRD